jgi:hypothetical protein
MERHAIDEEEAFKMLRNQARRSQRKIVDIAEAVLSTHTHSLRVDQMRVCLPVRRRATRVFEQQVRSGRGAAASEGSDVNVATLQHSQTPAP